MFGFYATITFRGGDDYYNMNALTFCLRGEYRECSIAKLAWRMGLYDQAEVMTKAFGLFLDSCYKDFPNGEAGASWWSTISNGVYIPSAAQEGTIRSPIHRFIHQFISSSINMQKDDDKVPSRDLFFLWCIIMPNTYCNIPYCLERYLAEGGLKDRKTS